jgi:hypothetical protein
MYGNAINIFLKLLGKFHTKLFVIPHSDCMVLGSRDNEWLPIADIKAFYTGTVEGI